MLASYVCSLMQEGIPVPSMAPDLSNFISMIQCGVALAGEADIEAPIIKLVPSSIAPSGAHAEPVPLYTFTVPCASIAPCPISSILISSV